MNNRYSDGSLFLKIVTEKLRQRLDRLKESLSIGEKEIEHIQEYYWENYAEMDQYGYEEFDNRSGTVGSDECKSRTVAIETSF